jgi:transcriptional regulator with XRE-family HTH domain
MPRENLIGEYLRARRELVRPEDIGVHDIGGRRRVAGLRRSEVALLAGVSTEYYVRLEQGRDQHPSPQVLDALARALQLDEYATAHLHLLANTPTARRRKGPRPEKAPARIAQLIQSWTETPAFVEGRYTDVLAANSLATALAPHYAWVLTSFARLSSIPAYVRCTTTGRRFPRVLWPRYGRSSGMTSTILA